MSLRILLIVALLPGLLALQGSTPLGFFLRSMKNSTYSTPLHANSQKLDGLVHYRLVPGLFPDGMKYHFDGLATVMQFRFADGQLTVSAKYFESDAEKNFKQCIFFGTGTGPTLGIKPCFTNPGVNLLPLNGQLWLTIDTAFWGRVDPVTLETLNSTVQIKSTVLNAHPACDPLQGTCFVQYPCSPQELPLTNQACIASLVWGASDMTVAEYSRITLPANKLIQHSHSPCVTPNYVVSKLDAFGSRLRGEDSGLLKFLHQVEDNEWMVMDRRTNVSRLMTSANTSFVNNHFWNCVEAEDGSVVVDTVAATGEYLDTYFEHTLVGATNWTNMFQLPRRCYIPPSGNAISCEPLFPTSSADANVLFDYPTFNPLFKMNPASRFFYATAAQSASSQWFDRLIKVDSKERAVVADWKSPGIFFTEASYVPRAFPKAEDDGYLLSVIYNSTADTSSLAVFDAALFELVDLYQLDQVIPFHAHGVSCLNGHCFSNP